MHASPTPAHAPGSTTAEPGGGHSHGEDHQGHVKTYLWVFFSLALFTAIEYFYARIFKDAFFTLVIGLLTWAVIKATLVGLYFMHLKYEGKWVYAMLVPSGILACVLVFALLPDIAMQPVTEINTDEDPRVGDDSVALDRTPAEGILTNQSTNAEAGKTAH